MMKSILDDLDLLGETQQPSDGMPLQLALASIDEDPEQPRKEYDESALAELAETIRDRGVKSPISVRPHPNTSGRWVLNFGSRRLRASSLAGRSEIPAFVDACADSYDQVIENEQREPLTPLELALFIQRRQALGETQNEIARRLGKSPSFVTFVTSLIDPPDWLIKAYREGRCRGLKELYDLRRIHRDHPQEVELWLSSEEAPAITRARLDEFRTRLEQTSDVNAQTIPTSVETGLGSQIGAHGDERGATGAAPQTTPLQARPPARDTRFPAAPARLLAEADGSVFAIDIERVPREPGMVYVIPRSGGAAQVMSASTLKLLGFARVDVRTDGQP